MAKLIIGFGALVGTEASYGSGVSLSTSTDGAQGVEPPVMDIEYSYDGQRPTPPGTAGQQAYASPTGETCQGTIAVELRGRGSSYSGANTPPNVHALLQASGLSGSYSGSVWTYAHAPIGTEATSAGMRIYTRSESFSVSGAFCDMEITTDGGAPMQARFNFQGLPTIPVDETLPVITYNDTLPPKTTDIGFEWGAVTGLKIRSLSIATNREIAPRQDLNAVSGSAGFAVGRRAPTMTLTVEAEALSTFNPYQEVKDKNIRDWTFTVGSVQFNRYTIGGKGQITSVSRTEDGPVATYDLQIALITTSGFNNDDFYITFS